MQDRELLVIRLRWFYKRNYLIEEGEDDSIERFLEDATTEELEKEIKAQMAISKEQQ